MVKTFHRMQKKRKRTDRTLSDISQASVLDLLAHSGLQCACDQSAYMSLEIVVEMGLISL